MQSGEERTKSYGQESNSSGSSYKMNSTSSTYPQENAAGSRSGGKELNKMLEEMKV